MKNIVMNGVREYGEEQEVSLGVDRETKRIVIYALNESRFNCTLVDLMDVILWLRKNKPELLGE